VQGLARRVQELAVAPAGVGDGEPAHEVDQVAEDLKIVNMTSAIY